MSVLYVKIFPDSFRDKNPTEADAVDEMAMYMTVVVNEVRKKSLYSLCMAIVTPRPIP